MMRNFLILTIALGLTACGDTFNALKMREQVVQEFKTTEIFQNPKSRYSYIVRANDGAIYIVENMDPRSPKITTKVMIFPPK